MGPAAGAYPVDHRGGCQVAKEKPVFVFEDPNGPGELEKLLRETIIGDLGTKDVESHEDRSLLPCVHG